MLAVPEASLRWNCACGVELLAPAAGADRAVECLACGRDSIPPAQAKPDESRPKLQLRRGYGASASNQARECPSCHHSLPQDSVFCTSCGLNLQTGKRQRAARRQVRLPVVPWGGLFKLALLVCVLYFGYTYRTQGWQWAQDVYHRFKARAPREVVENCAVCMGYGTVKCPDCGGRGSVERTTSKPCDFCHGTGQHQKRFSSTPAMCPSCKGSGWVKESGFATCETCGGATVISCRACGGKGKITKTI